jgi:hypothetical protein
MFRLAPVLADLGDRAGAGTLLGEARQVLMALPDGAEAQLARLAQLEQRLAYRPLTAPGEPITDREREVLRLLQGTLSMVGSRSAAMRVPDDTPRRYRIVFRGECGHVFAGVFSDLVVESSHGYTSVVAAVRDASEFYGLLDRFQDLALQPVSLNEIGGGSGAEAAGVTPRGGPAPATW